MKNNFNKKNIDRHLEYIESKQQEYLDNLDTEDNKKASSKPNTHERLAQLQERKLKYQQLKEQLDQTDGTQISTQIQMLEPFIYI